MAPCFVVNYLITLRNKKYDFLVDRAPQNVVASGPADLKAGAAYICTLRKKSYWQGKIHRTSSANLTLQMLLLGNFLIRIETLFSQLQNALSFESKAAYLRSREHGKEKVHVFIAPILSRK